jgi:hypothetical protein
MGRVILAGILGGILMFMAGAFEHMVLSWCDRAIQGLPDDKAFREFLAGQNLKHGIYSFPGPGTPGTEEEWNQLNETYKRGPNGMLFIGRTGEDMMTGRELGMEAASNVAVALMGAFIVSRLSYGSGFGVRWLVVLLIGIAGWMSISASHAIWYRFHWNYIWDELLCAILEFALAGLVIAALVKPSANSASTDPS